MSLKDDIKKTIEYAESYHCRLTKEQIYGRLISKNNYKLRITNYEFKHQKLDKAKNLAQILRRKFKNILFIGVTGSVATEFPKKNDDIDLFIIVKRNTLWMTRFWVRFYIWKNGIPHRKYGKKERKDEFCFNMWLDEDALLLPKNRQILRNAVDLVLMKPVLNKNKTYEKFLKANDWAKRFVATPYHLKSPSRLWRASPFDKRGNSLDYLINIFYFIPQYIFMWPKMRGQIVDLHRAMWGEGK